MIYAFYSFKGGVGRSMALANIAQWFYQQGLRVVMIDWDLEAPGLESYFYSTEEQLELVYSQIGLIDLLTAYKRQYVSLSVSAEGTQDQTILDEEMTTNVPLEPSSAEGTQDQTFLNILQKHLPPLSLALYPIYPLNSSDGTTSRALWLIPAGLRAGGRISLYSQMVQSFDWADFYARFRGELYFEWLRFQLESLADVVLIDSRTGVTEMSGVCTRQLADVVISFCAPNLQSIAGVEMMVESFLREDVLALRKGRSLDMVVVPARLDNSEQDAKNQFREQFSDTFNRYAPLAFKQARQTFWDLKIPYIPKYAYVERLTIGTTERAEDLEEAYKRLAASFVLLSPQQSTMRGRFAAELQRLFVFDSFVPRVLISYAYSDGASFAANLRQRLEKEGISLSPDSSVSGMDAGREWSSQISEALHQSEYLVLVMTPGALQSRVVREEWRYARRQGICILPVSADPKLVDFTSLPRWMRDLRFYDLDREWYKFVNDLNTRCQQSRIPFMAEDLPDDFVARPREMAEMINMLLDTKREEPISATVALYGAGGYGKTMLARALCHDERIQDAFDDGIVWVALGPDPGNLIGKIEGLIYILNQERVSFTHIDVAVARFVELISSRDILLVIDDVWNAEHLKPFLQGGNRCARLITTRNVNVLPTNVRRIQVGAFSQQEAVHFLSAGLPGVTLSSDVLYSLRTLASQLGEWPLLLNLVNGVLRERVSKYQQSLPDALVYINKALDKRGLTAFDARDAQDRSQAVALTLGISFGLLSEDEYARYKELAVFPEDVDIPLATLQKLWGATGGLDDFDTETLCERLFGLSLLLDFNLTRRTIRLHDAVHTYLREEIGKGLTGLHRQLLNTYALTCWADLPRDEPYLWDHLADHLVGAGNVEELLSTVKDLRYLAMKMLLRGSHAVEADLLKAQNLAPDDRQVRLLKRNIAQMGYLLDRGETFADIAAVLHSRLVHLSELADLCQPFEGEIPRPYLVPQHALPDLPHPALTRTLHGHASAVTSCAISPSVDFIVSASEDKTLKLWDALTGQERLTLQGHTGVVNACAVSPAGNFIVSASGDNTLKLWDAFTGQELRTLRGHSNAVIACAVSSKFIVSASSDRTLRVWDPDTGAARLVLEGHTDTVRSCAISSDENFIVSASHNGILKVWNDATGQELLTLRGHSGAVYSCAVSPDGTWIVSASDDTTLRLWDAQSGAGRLILRGHSFAVRGCAVSPAGDFIVSASSDHTLKLWDTITGAMRQTLYGHSLAVRGCAVSPAGDFIVSASSDHTLKLWSTALGLESFTPDVHKGIVNACAVPATQSFVAAAWNNGALRLLDAVTGLERLTLQEHARAVTACAVSPAGDLIVSASEDTTLKLWDALTGQELRTLQGHAGTVAGCAVSPAGDFIVSASWDQTLKVWDAATGLERHTLQGHVRAVTACAVSPAGDLIVSASYDKTLKLWEAFTGKELRTLQGHTGVVTACAVSPAGDLIVSASEDRTLKLWDRSTGRELLILSGHQGAVRSCAISPAGNLIASTSEDGALKVWDAQSAVCLTTLFVDGELLASAFYDDTSIVAGGAGGLYFLRLVS
jgi:WD40 repeat protein